MVTTGPHLSRDISTPPRFPYRKLRRARNGRTLQDPYTAERRGIKIPSNITLPGLVLGKLTCNTPGRTGPLRDLRGGGRRSAHPYLRSAYLVRVNSDVWFSKQRRVTRPSTKPMSKAQITSQSADHSMCAAAMQLGSCPTGLAFRFTHARSRHDRRHAWPAPTRCSFSGSNISGPAKGHHFLHIDDFSTDQIREMLKTAVKVPPAAVWPLCSQRHAASGVASRFLVSQHQPGRLAAESACSESAGDNVERDALSSLSAACCIEVDVAR